MPEAPHLRNVCGLPRMAASLLVNCSCKPSMALAGNGWPWSLLRSGLGSNVSMWLGPPCMNRKRIRATTTHDCSSIDRDELVGIEKGEAQLGQRRLQRRSTVLRLRCIRSLLQEQQGPLTFRPCSGAAKGQLPGTRHDFCRLV